MTLPSNIYLYRRVLQAKLFIEKHYDMPLQLDQLSDEASFSKFHFIRIFKKVYGKTPHQFLIWVRIEKAKVLLQQNIPVASVCVAVGFESVSSFTALFKRLVFLTPASYQRMHLDRLRQIKKLPLQFIPNCFAEKNGWTNKSNFE